MLYLDIGGVNSTGLVSDCQPLAFSKAPSRARRIARRGDTIISTVRTYLRAIAFLDDPPENLIVSTGFAVLHPSSGVIPKYLFYLATSQQFVDTVMANSVGVGYPAISPAALSCLPALVPSPPEQEHNPSPFRPQPFGKPFCSTRSFPPYCGRPLACLTLLLSFSSWTSGSFGRENALRDAAQGANE